jgi:hypothetical protein
MEELTRDEYIDRGGNPDAGVSGEQTFFAQGESLGVVVKDDEERLRALALEETPYFPTQRVAEAKTFSSYDGMEGAKDWLQDQL